MLPQLATLVLLACSALALPAIESSLYDPALYDAAEEDAHLKVPELIAKYGYPVETHYVTTSDGYILCMHRIPHGKNGSPDKIGVPFFVQHGLLSSSADWLITGPNKGLAYNLADAGFDVWLGNFRGNSYSRNHTILHPDRNAKLFWNFSWHEMGIIDLPQMIDYVLATTGYEQLLHVGHSQGTTTFYVMCSQLPEYNKKILAHISLAPIAYMKNLTSPFMQALSLMHEGLDFILSMIGINEFLPKSSYMQKFGQILCSDASYLQPLCTNSLFIICGFNPKQMNATLLPIMMGHTPAGSSTKQFLHYAQNIRGDAVTLWRQVFRQYDYGIIENKKRYGTITPPSYDLSKIDAPAHVIYSSNDWLSHPTDVHKLVTEMNNVQETILVRDNNFNHLDYLFALNAPTVVNAKVIEIAKSYV